MIVVTQKKRDVGCPARFRRSLPAVIKEELFAVKSDKEL